MSRRRQHHQPPTPPPAVPPSVTGFVVAALTGLGFAGASTWVHYRLLNDPTYVTFCDAGSSFSCSTAYTSQYGSVGGVSVALVGVVYFAFVLALVALCRQSASARENLAGYIFATATLGLAAVLYLAYASLFVLGTLCLLCLGTYAAIIALFLLSGARTRFPMTTLPGRAARDLRLLVRTPVALSAAAGFVAAAVAAVLLFPGEPVAASAGATATSTPAAEAQVPAAPAAAVQQLEQYLAAQRRANVPADASGAQVVIVKFNDYQCPPCRQTWEDYKPVLAKWERERPGTVRFITRDYPLDPECNPFAPGGSHTAACEAAVAVRLAREQGKADEMEQWLFSNQPSLTPQSVRDAARIVGGVSDWDARYGATLALVRADITQGGQLGVRGTPTFFMNGIQLPGLRAEFFDAAIQWELRQKASTP